jgi:hypothetical protein
MPKKRTLQHEHTVEDLRAPTTPVNPHCLHCVLTAAASAFQRTHADYPADAVLKDLGDLTGYTIASMIYGNPVLDTDRCRATILGLVNKHMRKALAELLADLQKRSSVN